jgi:SNF2 family DNA or RNA helicase
MALDYPWRTKPFSHQQQWFEETRDRPAFGILWEQGTGKSKLTIDTAGWMFLRGKIDCLLVLAPNGVHRNWTLAEVPTHLPAEVPRTTLLWHSSKANNVGFQREAKAALGAKGLLVVAMSYDAIMTKAGDAFVMKLLTQRRVLFVLDESVRIKNPKAKRTIRVLARGKGATFRRILTGTPVANSPFDVFTQFQFLSPAIWHKIGCRSFAAFKNYFGVWTDKMDPRSGRLYRDLVRYRNLNKLAEITAQVGCRVTKEEVLDLPPKLYTKRYFDLSPTQQRYYREMADSYAIRLDAGEVTAVLVIVQLLRFQQIISGFVVDEDDNEIALEENPRLELLREIIEETEGKVLVFGKFKFDINAIMRVLKEDGVSAVRYDGSTKEADRQAAVEAFQNGDARVLVGNPATIKEGLTLHAASTVIYYNNSYKLTDRLQSEDRAHRIGQRKAVTYIDIVAADTVDEKIADALREKLDVASIITGDKLKEWI